MKMKAYNDYPPYKYLSGLNDYTPSCWVIVKFTSPEHGVIYKVLAGGGGGYLHGHTWKLSSGITKVEMDYDKFGKKFFTIHNHSGSRYFCYEDSHGLRMSIAWKYNDFKEKLGDQMEDYDDLWNIMTHDWSK
jgi:hypothetical protein